MVAASMTSSACPPVQATSRVLPAATTSTGPGQVLTVEVTPSVRASITVIE